jgi:transcriptional regulator with XRE-family HTH domain
MAMPEPRTRLDQAMTERSLELSKRWVHIAKEAGITTSALSGIRRGDYKPSALTARRLEDALQWEYGSIDETLAGGEPTPRAIRVTEAYTPEREPTPAETWAEMERRDKARAAENAELRRQLEQVLRELREEREGGEGQRPDQRDTG